jgi:acetoin utilization deacetylase AcuC-like enzyme
MSLLILSSDRFAGHEPPPGHAERPERSDVLEAVAGEWRRQGAEVIEPRPATREQLCRVHDESFVDAIASTSGHATMLDEDTFTSPESFDVASLAAGAAIEAVERVMGGSATRAAALVRPPGHHAGPDAARGFCLFNNAAAAAAHALALGAPRVAIVDFDVHHGNGTQEIFHADPRVLYLSLHQFPHYPGTGWASEVGGGEGAGYTINVPLDAGATDADYDLVFCELVVPVLREYSPGVILVSAGYDAHEQDPLGGMRVTTGGFARMSRHLVGAAERCCAGRLVMTTEGGYELKALAASLDATLRAMADQGGRQARSGGADDGVARCSRPAIRGETALAAVRAAQARYWRGL